MLLSVLRRWRTEALRRPKVTIAVLVLVIFVLWNMSSDKALNLRERLYALPCKDEESKRVIEEVCNLYHKKEIVGDLCEPLCKTQTIQFTQCLNYKRGKHVIAVQCKEHCYPFSDTPAVLKMSRLKYPDLRTHLQEAGKIILNKTNPGVNPNTVDLQRHFITSESLTMVASDLIQAEYGHFAGGEEQDIIGIIWGDSYADYFKDEYTNLAFARILWTLLQQNEFRISRAFSDWEVFPQVYSFCGPMYIAEHSPPFKSLDTLFPLLNYAFPSWNSRAQLAIQILELVQRMDTMEHPLHLCDIKSPHFGVGPAGQVRFIDADTVFADEALSRLMSSQVCAQHSDCMFYDCEGACDKNTGKCRNIRTNNNLQVVCSKVFQGWALSTYGGLLSTPPKSVAAKLTALVSRCSTEVTGDPGEAAPMKKPGEDILVELQKYLMESLDMDPNANETEEDTGGQG